MNAYSNFLSNILLTTFRKKKKRKKILGNDKYWVIFPVVNRNKARDKYSMANTSIRQVMGQKKQH